MSIVSQKRGGLALFGSPIHASSHRIRLVCQAKDLEIDYVEIDPDNIPSDLIEINPTGRLPTLIDRDLVLFDERVVSEYLDERFPHPALMPIEANLKAKIRLFCYELETNWYQPVDQLQHGKLSPAKKKSAAKTTARIRAAHVADVQRARLPHRQRNQPARLLHSADSLASRKPGNRTAESGSNHPALHGFPLFQRLLPQIAF